MSATTYVAVPKGPPEGLAIEHSWLAHRSDQPCNPDCRAWRHPDAPTVPLVPRPLTGREDTAMRLLVLGKSYKEIASAMRVTPSTARTHIHNAYQALGARHRGDALLLYMRRRLPDAADLLYRRTKKLSPEVWERVITQVLDAYRTELSL